MPYKTELQISSWCRADLVVLAAVMLLWARLVKLLKQLLAPDSHSQGSGMDTHTPVL